MMLRILLVVALATVAVVHADDCCSAEDRKELQFIWKKLWSSSFTDRKVAIAGAVFEDIFNRYPEAKNLFKRVHVDDPKSGEWKAHLVRVANGLDTIINLMSDPDVLAQQLEHLSNQHVARAGVKAAYFKAMGTSFENVLSQVATCFNVEAFDRCFTRVANIISAKLP
jgi:hemoglobin-like flavoprotein